MAFLRGSSIYCIGEKEMDMSRRVAFSSVCITTATISAFGAIVQLVNWCKRLTTREPRRIPSPTPHVVFSLALADLFACVGAISMSILFLSFKPAVQLPDGRRIPYDYSYMWIGIPIESFTMFAYISSYMWTLFYSLDVCLQVHNRQSCFCSKAYHLMSWPLAAWLVGFGQYAYFGSKTYCSSHYQALVHYLVCYVPLLFVMLALPIIYRKAYKKVSQNIKRNGYFTDAERSLQQSVRKKFCLIVFVFVFCWLANFVDGIHDLVLYYTTQDNKGFDEDGDHFALWMIEALVNTQQGFLNCLVYGQHRQFASFCSHVLSLGRNNSACSINNYHCITGSVIEQRHDDLTVNSCSGVRIPVSEISPLLQADSPRTPLEPSPSQAPFPVKLLGEFSR